MTAANPLASLRKRAARVRRRLKKVAGERPRLSVFRSGKHIYAQVIDDRGGRTLAAASTLEPGARDGGVKGSGTEAAAKVGKLVAERALEKDVSEVVFDRGGYLFHGRVKALAEAAREAGLKF